ncbi:transducin-like enhancer protein 1 [Lates japonicus]|uniref:Transducin-like enhancer protein 1 n=1 Tax=Lates japonicus TaxID=270547 RepID=A0AAD3R3T1_LATJO|nr:transducin-like enhancer protein 1 [Lates japonicus]
MSAAQDEGWADQLFRSELKGLPPHSLTRPDSAGSSWGSRPSSPSHSFSSPLFSHHILGLWAMIPAVSIVQCLTSEGGECVSAASIPEITTVGKLPVPSPHSCYSHPLSWVVQLASWLYQELLVPSPHLAGKDSGDKVLTCLDQTHTVEDLSTLER